MKYLLIAILAFLSLQISAQNSIKLRISNNWYSDKNINKPLFKGVYFFDETPKIPYYMVTVNIPTNSEIENIVVDNKNYNNWNHFKSIINDDFPFILFTG